MGDTHPAGGGAAGWWRKLALIPLLSRYALTAPRTQARAWELYWSRVGGTGPSGDVLWDAGEPAETAFVVSRLRAHADLTLPMVDVGCGNGRQARALAGVAARVVGLDAAPAAIRRATAESPAGSTSAAGSPAGGGSVEFRVADATRPGLGERLAAELGDANVHLRGVLHVLDRAERRALAGNLAHLAGRRGTIVLCETDAAGDPLEYLLRQGATPTRLPEVLRRCVAAGLRPPRHFGPEQVSDCFPASHWRVVEQGPTTVHGVPLRPGGPLQRIPAFFAVLRAR